jgi:undecaprenyl pyrophosphate phosphatase UppP
VSAHLGFTEAIIVGIFQGINERFPVSSLGHAVLVPAILTIVGALTCLSMAHLRAAIADRPARPLVLVANADDDSAVPG